MESASFELAKLLAGTYLEQDGYLEYTSLIPVEVMKQLRAEGKCILYTYSWKTQSGAAELRWYALEKK